MIFFKCKKYIEASFIPFLKAIPFIPWGNHYPEVEEHLSHPFFKCMFPKIEHSSILKFCITKKIWLKIFTPHFNLEIYVLIV